MSLDICILYQQHCKELLLHLLRFIKCPEIAQDLVQESYLILVRTSTDTYIVTAFTYKTEPVHGICPISNRSKWQKSQRQLPDIKLFTMTAKLMDSQFPTIFISLKPIFTVID
jgi:RNA polymerase sigma-70 factor (ECF subfamily)